MKTALALLAVLTLAACSRGSDAQQPAAAESPDAHPDQRTVAEAPACPYATFDAFLERFMADETVQRAFVKAPLSDTRLDSASDEPRPVRKELAADQIVFPVIPSREAIAASGRTFRIEGAADRRRVEILKPDTDWQTYYDFERTDCWRLVAVDDRSL